jgi:hypothetical protein
VTGAVYSGLDENMRRVATLLMQVDAIIVDLFLTKDPLLILPGKKK